MELAERIRYVIAFNVFYMWIYPDKEFGGTEYVRLYRPTFWEVLIIVKRLIELPNSFFLSLGTHRSRESVTISAKEDKLILQLYFVERQLAVMAMRDTPPEGKMSKYVDYQPWQQVVG
jgi:hypothetical protein